MPELYLPEDCIPAITQALTEPLPGPAAQQTMSVSPRSQWPDNESIIIPRHGAVLLLLYPCQGELYIALTRRHTRLRHHGGQIALPGGVREERDASLWDTARREAEEEIGVSAKSIVQLGRLTPLEIPVSGFIVQPFVGYAEHRPSFRLQTTEVEALIELPLHILLDKDAHAIETWQLHGRSAQVPFYRYKEVIIWGATAMILAEMEAILHQIVPGP